MIVLNKKSTITTIKYSIYILLNLKTNYFIESLWYK